MRARGASRCDGRRPRRTARPRCDGAGLATSGRSARRLRSAELRPLQGGVDDPFAAVAKQKVARESRVTSAVAASNGVAKDACEPTMPSMKPVGRWPSGPPSARSAGATRVRVWSPRLLGAWFGAGADGALPGGCGMAPLAPASRSARPSPATARAPLPPSCSCSGRTPADIPSLRGAAGHPSHRRRGRSPHPEPVGRDRSRSRRAGAQAAPRRRAAEARAGTVRRPFPLAQAFGRSRAPSPPPPRHHRRSSRFRVAAASCRRTCRVRGSRRATTPGQCRSHPRRARRTRFRTSPRSGRASHS